MSDCRLVAPRVYCDVNAGIVFKLASLEHAVETAVKFCTLNERDLPPVTWPAYWPASLRISMMATFQRGVQLTACFKNDLTGTGRCNNIHDMQHIKQPIGISTNCLVDFTNATVGPIRKSNRSDICWTGLRGRLMTDVHSDAKNCLLRKRRHFGWVRTVAPGCASVCYWFELIPQVRHHLFPRDFCRAVWATLCVLSVQCAWTNQLLSCVAPTPDIRRANENRIVWAGH